MLSNGCSGVLIDPKWILTASHCVDVLGRGVPVSAAVGIVDRRNFATNSIKIDYIDNTFGYRPSSGENDIALLRLKTPVTIAKSPLLPEPGVNDPLYQDKITISDSNGKRSQVGQNVVGVGWGCVGMLPTPTGYIDPASFLRDIVPSLKVYSNTLQKITLPIHYKIFNKVATKFYFGTSDEWSLTNTACSGDSGGPIFPQSEKDKRYVIGITTQSYVGIKPGTPNATRVIDFTAKIREHMKFLEKVPPNNQPNN